MEFTLGTAAKELGITKPTLSKAIAKGKLSATRREDGSYSIDAAELFRYRDANQHRYPPETGQPLQTETGGIPLETGKETISYSALKDVLEAKNEAERERIRREELEKRLALLNSVLDDMKQERDHWRETANRALLTYQPPKEPEAATSQAESEGRGFFSWFRRKAG